MLEKKLKQVLRLETVTVDTMKTLELYREGRGYNVAAELLADENSFCGMDIVRFGDSLNVILDRETYEHESVLTQYDRAVALYRKYYRYEQIRGAYRETVSLVPEEAYREAIANALVHRTWDVPAHIHVEMLADRIEITSPGGLPKGMREEEYFRGGISILRNRILGNVFLRLQMIERFGTGIRRINEAYAASEIKPVFGIHENSIRVTLPVLREKSELSGDERTIYALVKGRAVSSSVLAEQTGFGKTKVLRLLKKLVAEGYLRTLGSGRGLRYTADGLKVQ